MARSRTRHILPWRYGMFLALLATAIPIGIVAPWHEALMGGFDIAGLGFLLSLRPLFNADAARMRRNAVENDANREVMLLITGIVMLIVLIAVGVAVSVHGGPRVPAIVLLLTTLGIAWLFSNMVYALHYAHIFYVRDGQGEDSGGFDFPEQQEPDCWDFVYFAFTLGMTFQTSDVSITSTRARRIVIFHCLAAFVFNLGILAFTINVLGGGS